MTGVVFSPLIPPPALLFACAFAAVLIGYGIWHRAKGVFVRVLPIAALLVALADPQLVSEQRQALKDVAVIVVDESDSQKLGRREERTAEALESLSAELAKLDDLEVRTVHAGRNAVAGGQGGTRLFDALTSALGDIPSQRLAASFLISDGQIHDAQTPERAAQSHAAYLSAPLHLMVSGEHKEYDRRIRVENAPDFGLVGQPATISLKVEDNEAEKGARIPITITRNGGKTQQLNLPAGVVTDIPLQVENTGSNVYEIEAASDTREVSALNNRTIVSINGIRDRMRVLLISGQPHVGERAWRNLLKSDPNIDLTHFTILRPLSKDDGTPLTELALIAFPMRELFEEQLKKFDLIIFDRYSQKDLVSFQYMANVASYVRDGGAIMLAVGPEYADSFSLFGSALQGVLPAEPAGHVFDGAFRPHLSETGQRHPVTSSLDGAGDNGAGPTWGRWLRQIEVRRANGVHVLTGHDDQPLLILDHVAQGRVALLLSDTIWLWGKGVDGGGPQTELLRRVAHWLMKEPELEEESLSAEVRDSALQITRQSLTPEEVPVAVTAPSGQERTVTPTGAGGGKFVARINVTEPGLYTLTDGKKTTITAVGAPNPLETYDVLASESRVGPLAQASGGGVYWLEDGAPSLRRTVPGRVSHGATWMGVKANKQFAVTGVTQTSLTPVALILFLILGGSMLAWWREGK
jgi:hypothetical protein